MRVLFIHPNFPAQFRHMAAALGANARNQVVFATMNERPEWKIPGVRKAVFGLKAKPPEGAHFLAAPFQEAAMKGEAAYFLARELQKNGFTPDVVVGHSGWGTTMFLKDAFPRTPMLCYFEWFYRAEGADVNFDPADPLSAQGRVSLRTKNIPILVDMEACDFGYCPTFWQHRQLPQPFRPRITVRHDGIDTRFFVPDPHQRLVLPGLDLSLEDEIVTYATRGMEPYRGFPQFMQAVELLLERRPNLHVVVAGEDRVCYGKKRADGKTYKQAALERLKLDPARVHFTGPLAYRHYRTLLQASTVHVYLTRPFVLSWSLLEAMACGCLVVSSDTPPVREVVRDGVNGLLTDFFSAQAIADRVDEALERRREFESLRAAARATVLRRYDLAQLLPGHLRLVANLAAHRHPLEGVAVSAPPDVNFDRRSGNLFG
ncbi:MAG: glycosyltransferase [Desulfovibrionaceae bacterium]|jgi:glycosyltransferase involved in cell wall biosynthesis|nr:glycosyltransferase [Desulfovibrionaceae bacterium]